MKIAGAIFCFLLSFVSLLGSIDASGCLQDAPPIREQLKWELPFAAGCAFFAVAGVGLIIWHVQKKRLS